MQGIKACDVALSTPATDARTGWHTGGITEIDVISLRWTLTYWSDLSFVRIVRQIQTTARAENVAGSFCGYWDDRLADTSGVRLF